MRIRAISGQRVQHIYCLPAVVLVQQIPQMKYDDDDK